ncbi:hypothetical protein NL676_038499 [Syzygium grande]|nr:hypothetical protein NL676_038499 [Syzygium grande]
MQESFAPWLPAKKKKSVDESFQLQRWRPAEQSFLEINVNGAYLEGTYEGAVAGVCQDSSRRLINGFSWPIEAFSAAQAKATALVEA